jgi:hypothetical protein
MDSEKIFWAAISIYAVVILLHNGAQLLNSSSSMANWLGIAGALFLIIGVAGTLYRSSRVKQTNVPQTVYYVGSVGALLAVVSIAWEYL